MKTIKTTKVNRLTVSIKKYDGKKEYCLSVVDPEGTHDSEVDFADIKSAKKRFDWYVGKMTKMFA